MRSKIQNLQPNIIILSLGLFILALLPRCLGLADFYTIDEGYHWPGRVENFANAIITHDWAATNQSGHPGVTTMWLGALGRWIGGLRGIQDPGWAGGGATYLAALRLPLAIVNSLAVVSGYLVLRRLLRPSIALLAALLWAGSPFLIAHSRVLHLDALLTSFMTLGLLMLLAALRIGSPDPNRPFSRLFLIGSGICAGLALLTKAPSLVILPVAGILLITQDEHWPAGQPLPKIAALRQFAWGRGNTIIGRYIIWASAAALTAWIGWPALWVTPLDAISNVIGEIVGNGGQPHHSGNFFMGQPVADPGWMFYPAVVLWRNTPLTLLGLIGLAITSLTNRRNTTSTVRQPICALLLFALIFGMLIGSLPKKLDRYLLPIWPTLEIMAAIGLAALAEWLKQSISYARATRLARLPMIGGILAGTYLAITLFSYFPYYLAYFNPLLGGGVTAQRIMLVGWGEGFEQVGAWLNRRPDLERGPVLSWIPPSLAPFVPKSVLVLDLREQHLNKPSSYAVLYVRSVQHKESLAAETVVRQMPKLYTLRMYGIEYASIHQLPRPFDTPVDTVFGAGLHLRGFSQTLQQRSLVITPSWDIQADQPGGRFVFIHLLDAAGQRVAQIDAPLDQGMFAEWQAGQQFDPPLPLALPAELPPGAYRLILGVYDPTSGARMPITSGIPLPPEISGPHAIELGIVQIPN